MKDVRSGGVCVGWGSGWVFHSDISCDEEVLRQSGVIEHSYIGLLDIQNCMTALSDWSLVRSFLAVMRGGSLSAAARTTRLTQPTIGRHVDEIEASLGLALFTRSPSGLIPTEAARSLLSSAEAMEAAMASLIRTAESGGDVRSPRGTVRIAASEIMGNSIVGIPAQSMSVALNQTLPYCSGMTRVVI